MSLRACRTPPSYGWLRGLRTNTPLDSAPTRCRQRAAGNLGLQLPHLYVQPPRFRGRAPPRHADGVPERRLRRVAPRSRSCRKTDGPANGEFVIYFNGVTVRHSGIWMGGRVQSKWGTGHLWEHALHEVPLRYGDEVGFFCAVPAERCIAAVVVFARRGA